MKRIIILLGAIFITFSTIIAQTPQMFKYQAVLRDADGNIMADETVTIDISILQSDLTTSVFDESHTNIITTAQGLINLNIGSVNTTDLALIDWTVDEYFIEITVNGTIMGTSQLLSVPYALQAKEVENIDYGQINNTPFIPSDISDLTDNSGLLFDGDYNSLINLPFIPADISDLTDNSGLLFDGEWSSLLNTPTTISGYGITDAFDGDYNSLTNLPILFDGEWSSLLNNPTTISGYGITDAFDGEWSSLTGTPPNISIFTNDAGYLTSEVDGSVTNEIQILSLTGNDLTISGTGGNTITIPSADGSETKVTSGTNVIVTGSGTTASPYVINAVVSMTQIQRDALTATEGMVVYNSTTHKPNYYNGTEWMNYDFNSAKTFTIGESYQGGIIAYILQSGDPGYDANVTHCIIAAPTDQSIGIPWHNGFGIETGATATALGTGYANTNTIVTSQGAGSYAAKLCDELVLGGYSDWYLPSKDELNKLYINKAAIGGFSDTFYWSSSETVSDFSNAQAQFFGSGIPYNENKDTYIYVRAIRAF